MRKKEKKDANTRSEVEEYSKIFKSEFDEERLNQLKENTHLIKRCTKNDIDLIHEGKCYKNHLTLALAMYFCSGANPKANVYNNESLINNSSAVKEKLANEIEDELNFDDI